MRLGRSITFLATIAIATVSALVMVGATIVTIVVVMAMDEDNSSIGATSAVQTLKEAIARDAQGRLMVEPNGKLAALARNYPSFWYVVSDDRTTLLSGEVPGQNSQETPVRQSRIKYAQFEFLSDEKRLVGVAVSEETRAGQVLIEAGGLPLSMLENTLIVLSNNGPLLVLYGLILLATIASAVLVMPRLIARPVRQAAAEAEAIDGVPGGRRLADAGTPAELKPLVGAFNRALERIDAAAASQRNFLSNAAHELRTPLTKLRMKLEGVPDETIRASLVADVQHLSATVTTLLHLARLSGQPLAFAPVDLVALCRAAVAEVAPTALDRDIDIDFRADDPVVVVRGAEAAIRAAVTNLIENALRHAKATPSIVVEVTAPGRIRVIDSGCGIAVETRDVVLRPFIRGGHDDTEGAGLGLAIVAQVMSMHGGSVTIDETPGGGATFTLTFPA
ncbi:HAMP domain-containing sensor histidine kinase [Chelatococcus sp. SYSU_G07232]|uniref:histidine kinase n=1 Tax=Chelatococcus albus TaxID=3047466 RepID=A0ABT7AHS6_9HYPH|nr:HAMP domain-containing sensor histidine kinase [Chelatococcus sp. SYSU_G07232]MDJ1158924.1 HAMP domain-containing sensor histidine kinase [Chelatococcus sp. SYSU_G07232]